MAKPEPKHPISISEKVSFYEFTNFVDTLNDPLTLNELKQSINKTQPYFGNDNLSLNKKWYIDAKLVNIAHMLSVSSQEQYKGEVTMESLGLPNVFSSAHQNPELQELNRLENEQIKSIQQRIFENNIKQIEDSKAIKKYLNEKKMFNLQK